MSYSSGFATNVACGVRPGLERRLGRCLPELPWRDPRARPEVAGEVGLIAEAGGERDVAERRVAGAEGGAGPLEADAPGDLAHARAEGGAERLTEVGGVHAARVGQVRQGRRRPELRFELVSDVVQPRGSAGWPRGRGTSADGCEGERG